MSQMSFSDTTPRGGRARAWTRAPGRPGHRYTLELFGTRRRAQALVDAQGQGRFSLPPAGDSADIATFTATSDDGATSPLAVTP